MAEAIFRLTWAIWAITAILGFLSQYGPWAGNTATAAAHRQTATVVAHAPANRATGLRADASYTAPATSAAASATPTIQQQ